MIREEDLQKIIVDEFDHVINSMRSSNDVVEKLYFFSGAAAVINRVFNIKYNAELLFIHEILVLAHKNFIQRVDSIKRGDSTIPITEDQTEKLSKYLEILRDKILKNESFYSVLVDFTELSYSTNGNGNYLTSKGFLNI